MLYQKGDREATFFSLDKLNLCTLPVLLTCGAAALKGSDLIFGAGYNEGQKDVLDKVEERLHRRSHGIEIDLDTR